MVAEVVFISEGKLVVSRCLLIISFLGTAVVLVVVKKMEPEVMRGEDYTGGDCDAGGTGGGGGESGAGRGPVGGSTDG